MRFVSLFAGIGGIDLGLERAGWRCVAQVERDEFCQRVLEKHWPDVPRFGDIVSVRGVDLPATDALVGGFPCQPVSVAGKRRGHNDERWLWPEFFRLVREVRPHWIVAENVPALRTLGADGVVADLEQAGYAAWPLVVGADDLGAPHRRKRVFIVAHSLSAGLERHAGHGAGVHERGRLDAEPRGSASARGLRGPVLVADADCGDVRHGEQLVSGRRARGVRDEGASVAGGNGATAELADAARGGLGIDGRARCADRHADCGDARHRELADADGGRCGRVGEPEPRGIEGARGHVADGCGAGWTAPAWPAGPREQQHGWEPPRLVAYAKGVERRSGVGSAEKRVGASDERGRGSAIGGRALAGGEAESGLGVGPDGVPGGLAARDRRARLKALGNAVVPPVAEAIGRAILKSAALCIALLLAGPALAQYRPYPTPTRTPNATPTPWSVPTWTPTPSTPPTHAPPTPTPFATPSAPPQPTPAPTAVPSSGRYLIRFNCNPPQDACRTAPWVLELEIGATAPGVTVSVRAAP